MRAMDDDAAADYAAAIAQTFMSKALTIFREAHQGSKKPTGEDYANIVATAQVMATAFMGIRLGELRAAVEKLNDRP